jgi:phosphatidate cytidylyltransferase
MLEKRVISALILLPLLILVTICGGVLFKGSVIIITAIALFEYISAYRNTENKVATSVLIIGFIMYYAIILTNEFSFILPIIFFVVILSMAIPIFNENYNVISLGITLIGFVYIVCFFSMLILIREHIDGNILIWLVFIISWCSDTFAYYTGKTFGKRKLCPKVSPKKTVEGAIGGIIGSVLGLFIWAYINPSMNILWYQLIILGVIGSIFSVIGDLSASLIKRYIGIKDYSNIIPGHGGILDRFDSILFTAPVVYYCIVILLG